MRIRRILLGQPGGFDGLEALATRMANAIAHRGPRMTLAPGPTHRLALRWATACRLWICRLLGIIL